MSGLEASATAGMDVCPNNGIGFGHDRARRRGKKVSRGSETPAQKRRIKRGRTCELRRDFGQHPSQDRVRSEPEPLPDQVTEITSSPRSETKDSPMRT